MVVVMTAQYFGLNDVHLSLSEDHAWVVFGKNGEENAEVTWHGKRDEIKRGTPIGEGSLVKFSKDWLYLGGYGMKCDRKMEVAAIVSTMNPGIDSKTDSELLSRLQQAMIFAVYCVLYMLHSQIRMEILGHSLKVKCLVMIYEILKWTRDIPHLEQKFCLGGSYYLRQKAKQMPSHLFTYS